MRTKRGFSLIELMISIAVGAFVIAAAVTVTTDHTRVLGRATTKLDMHQGARLAMDLIQQDIRHAGVGIGYRPDGRFAGLMRGNFTVAGGAAFQTDDRIVSLTTGGMPTDDLGIRLAAGDMRSIAAYGMGSAEVCAGGAFKDKEVVVLTTREGIHARTVKMGPLSTTGCSRDSCIAGCQSFSFTADSAYVSDSAATIADYVGGELAGLYQEVVWFVTPDATGRGKLQRAEITSASPCTAADTTCGGTVADGVESVQIAVWQWDALTANWVDLTTATEINGRDRLRVDVELVMRAMHTDGQAGPKPPVQMELNRSACAPMPCGQQDTIPRWVTRSTVEIRNSGRMVIR